MDSAIEIKVMHCLIDIIDLSRGLWKNTRIQLGC